MATKGIRRQLRELEDALRTAVLELQRMTDLWNAADRVAGGPADIPYLPSATSDLAPPAVELHAAVPLPRPSVHLPHGGER